MKNLKKILLAIPVILITIFLLALSVKGDVGNPIAFQDSYDTRVGGPFESSGSTSRFALVKSIIDNNTVFFNTDLAKFASPDVVGFEGKYSTLFTPGVSFAALPFYYVGKIFGLSQLGAYLSTTTFTFFNMVLIYLISKKFKAGEVLSIISGLIFGLGTSALAYSNSMTQHHLSVFLILLSILNASGKRNILNNLLFGLIFGAGALVDIPNVFMMMPAGLYVFARHFIVENHTEKLKLKIKLAFIALMIGVLPMIGLFAWYNYQTVGSYTKLAQSVGRTDIFASDEIKAVNKRWAETSTEAKRAIPFATRDQLNGFYILLVSDERGIFYYNPIIIFGIAGLILAIRNKNNSSIAVLIASTASVNIILYSMFGDPWGGWSFGPRYLIPSLALFSTGIGYALSKFIRNPFVILAFVLTLIYSVTVSVLGATTTDLVPPKVEALNLAVTVPYTYFYNIQLVQTENAGVLIYNLFLRNLVNVETYVYFYSATTLTLILSLYCLAIIFAPSEVKVKNPIWRKLFSFNLFRRARWI